MGAKLEEREIETLLTGRGEEVALEAVVVDGRLIARTSARRLAEGLGIDPGTAASAPAWDMLEMLDVEWDCRDAVALMMSAGAIIPPTRHPVMA